MMMYNTQNHTMFLQLYASVLRRGVLWKELTAVTIIIQNTGQEPREFECLLPQLSKPERFYSHLVTSILY